MDSPAAPPDDEQPGDPLQHALRRQNVDPEQADAIRKAFVATGAMQAAGVRAERLAGRALAAIPALPLGAPAIAYLEDLIRMRITRSVERWCVPG